MWFLDVRFMHVIVADLCCSSNPYSRCHHQWFFFFISLYASFILYLFASSLPGDLHAWCNFNRYSNICQLALDLPYYLLFFKSFSHINACVHTLNSQNYVVISKTKRRYCTSYIFCSINRLADKSNKIQI